ncbi:MAG: hypothetical protein LBU18_01690 [Treponema sp.]|jgi:hypothetical protein|nr:hypothetical protein [Treponema sp.]
MKRKLLLSGILSLALVFGFCLAGCTTFQASGLQMGARNSQFQVLGDFTTKVWVHKFLGTAAGPTLFNIGSELSESVIQKTIMTEVTARGGTAAINIKLKWGSNPVQWILNGITYHVWAPTTLTVSGTVIKEN